MKDMLCAVVVASVLSVCATAQCADPKVWYVDNKLSSYEGHDGSSWTKAFRRIQEAVNKTSNGDTVLVAPGVYGDDQGTVIDNGDSTGKNQNYSYQPNRIWINNKHITLKSSEGAAVTHIVGKHADTETGIGNGAVRCISMSGTANLPGTRIEGFTIRDGASLAYGTGMTLDSDGKQVANCNAAHRGGGLLFHYTASETHRKIHVVDCVISNCVAAQGAAAYGVVLLRSHVTDNSTHMAYGGTVMQCNAYSCVFDSNGSVNHEGTIGVIQKSYPVTAVNCTFFNNKGILCRDGNDMSASVCNSLIQRSGALKAIPSDSWSGGTFSNCVADASIDTDADNVHMADRANNAQLAAPIFGDFRPVARPYRPHLFGNGDKRFCEMSWIPESDRNLDYLQDARWSDDDAVTVGAIQSGVEKKGGCITITILGLNDRYEINGRSVNGVQNGYFYSDESPVQYRVRYITGTVGTEVHNVWLGGYCNLTRFLDVNGSIVVTAPPTSSDSMLCLQAYGADKVVWADPNYTGGDSDGTEAKPYVTLQEAVDATAGASRPVVKAKAGRYDVGGDFIDGNCRVAITNSVCIRALNGPSETFIVGDCHDSDDGCGVDAYRCIGMKLGSLDLPAGIVGFTLTGGRTRSVSENCDFALKAGGALYSDANWRSQLIGCVISNCTAVQGSAAFFGWLQNCLVTDCRQSEGPTASIASRGVVKQSYLSGCVIGPNEFKTVSVDEGSRLWNCTINETNDSIRMSKEAYAYNVLVLNNPSSQSTLEKESSVAGLVIESSANLSLTNPYTKVSDAKVAARESGDVRPLADSVVLTAGTVNGVPDPVKYVIGGIYGGLFPPGQPIAGAAFDIAVPVTMADSRWISVDGGLGTGFTSLYNPLTLEAVDESRSFYGFKVNGELQTAGRKLTLMPGDESAAFSVEPLYAKRFVISVR